MWNDTALTRRLGIRYPIVQGPFGGVSHRLASSRPCPMPAVSGRSARTA